MNQMDPGEFDRRLAVILARLNVSEKYVGDIERGIVPVLESDREFARSYFTMAAGALTLSIVMAQFLATRGVILRPMWALAAAWCLFAFTLIATAARHALETGIRTVFAEFHRDWQPTLIAATGDIEDPEKIGADANRVINDRQVRALEKATKLGKLYDGYRVALALSCVAGYVLLLYFAIRSLA